MVRALRLFLRAEDGATAVEYGLLAALVSLGLLAALIGLGAAIEDMFLFLAQIFDAAAGAP